MQSHVDYDSGTLISGWVVPDNPSAIPRILVSVDRAKPVAIDAAIMRQDLKDLGMHRTGMVGFNIDETSCPGLGTAKNVLVQEFESQVLIYGRFDETRHVKSKLLLYELNAMPQTRIFASIQKRFAMSYDAVERHPFDTMFGIINNQFSESIFLAGRPNFKRYQQLLANRNFIVVTMLRDPYEEIAERLLFARYASRPNSPPHFMRHLSGLEPLVDLASRFDISSEHAMLSAFNSLEPAHEQVLANPYVQVLACENDEPAERRHVSVALDNLSRMNLVGLRQRFDNFKSTLQEIVGVDLLEDGQPVDVSWVPEIAAKLSRIDKVRSLLALDISLYNLARDAIRKAISIT
jgi:hypothetical protein